MERVVGQVGGLSLHLYYRQCWWGRGRAFSTGPTSRTRTPTGSVLYANCCRVWGRRRRGRTGDPSSPPSRSPHDRRLKRSYIVKGQTIPVGTTGGGRESPPVDQGPTRGDVGPRTVVRETTRTGILGSLCLVVAPDGPRWIWETTHSPHPQE